VVWRIVLLLEQSMGLTDEQRKASKAVVPDPPTGWLMGASLEGTRGMYSTASSRFLRDLGALLSGRCIWEEFYAHR
jgi:hypothetical protein